MCLISVIIPVYNVEAYLARCIESVIKQTYEKIEIILIDDGSQDNCPQICDEYAQRDSRISVIHKSNGGLSDARNTGLRIATGDFVTFVDSDDWIEPNFIEKTYTILIEHNTDIVITENLIENSKKTKSNQLLTKKCTDFNAESALEILLKKQPIPFVVSWGKLYKKKLFSNVSFPTRKFHEDEATSYKLFFYSKKITYLPQRLYHYFKRDNSITSIPHHQDIQDAIYDRLIFFKEQKLFHFYCMSIPTYCWVLLACCYEKNKSGLSFDSEIFALREKINEYNSSTAKTFFHWFFLNLFAIKPNMYFFYKRFF